MNNDLTDLNIEWIETFCKNIPSQLYQLQKSAERCNHSATIRIKNSLSLLNSDCIHFFDIHFSDNYLTDKRFTDRRQMFR